MDFSENECPGDLLFESSSWPMKKVEEGECNQNIDKSS